jgi:hypothetical protein
MQDLCNIPSLRMRRTGRLKEIRFAPSYLNTCRRHYRRPDWTMDAADAKAIPALKDGI